MNLEEIKSNPLWNLRAGYLAKANGRSVEFFDSGTDFQAVLPAISLENLGDVEFCLEHNIRFPFVSGAMANGIASVEIVSEMARAGMLGFFGAAGLSLEKIEVAIDQLARMAKGRTVGFNLIHSPNEPQLESDLVDLYLSKGVHLVEAAAFMSLTLPIVRYRLTGIYRDEFGVVQAPNKVVAKVSRIEVATKFFSPAPDTMLATLVEQGHITSQQALMAKEIPIAQDITAEADSGGHTDSRPALALIPTIVALRNRLQDQFKYQKPLRVGAAGGISTPESAAAAFTMGAAYIVTGSVNQSCIESGSSEIVRKMLCETEQADIAMAASADMFEMGVKVQVLKRGTMFPMRAGKLHELYSRYKSIEELPQADRDMLEKSIFKKPLSQVWSETCEFFERRDPAQVERAKADPHHLMALVFRSYLGQSSNWANKGQLDRRIDFQVWCGPAMGAFNEWVKGSFLEKQNERRIVTVSLNILFGAGVIIRKNVLRAQGINSDGLPLGWQPLPETEMWQLIGDTDVTNDSRVERV